MTQESDFNSEEYLRLCALARIACADLVTVDRELSATESPPDRFVVMTKHALLALANTYDLELTVRRAYRAHPDLSALYRPLEKRLAFARYLRNIYVGHINPDLIGKALEWKPELRTLLAMTENDDLINIHINLAVLETAINTYVDSEGGHKVFEGDTDLQYPPDETRFLIFLTEAVRGAIAFLKALTTAVHTHISPPSSTSENIQLFMKAGATDFRFITKGAR